MVEDEGGDAGRREALGEGPEPVAARPGEAVGHDHDRGRAAAAAGRIEPGGAGVATRVEDVILALHADKTRSVHKT